MDRVRRYEMREYDSNSMSEILICSSRKFFLTFSSELCSPWREPDIPRSCSSTKSIHYCRSAVPPRNMKRAGGLSRIASEILVMGRSN